MSELRVLYVVMRLQEEVMFNAPDGKEISSGKIGNLAGFLPVYETEAEALTASDNGNFEIRKIQTLRMQK